MKKAMPGVVPMIHYEDAAAALPWLERAFGFIEMRRFTGEHGRIEHAELDTGHGLVMAANAPSPHYMSPRSLRAAFEPARNWNDNPWVIDGVLVLVDDVDAHFARAQREGATILSPLEQGPPARRYRAEDIEGHRWMFMNWSEEET